MELLIDDPDYPQRDEILHAVERKLNWMDRYTTGPLYDLILQAIDNCAPDELNCRTIGRNAWICNTTYVYGLAGYLMKKPKWLTKAEIQIV